MTVTFRGSARVRATVIGLAILLATLFARLGVAGQEGPVTVITSQDLLDGFKNPSRWLMYSGDYTGRRHSPLTQITPANVGRLAAQWTFQTENMVTGRGFEGTPLMIDG